MTDCLSCKHAEPARSPDGSVDFRIKNCKRFPPTPVAFAGPGGQLQISAFFPTVGAGVRCAEYHARDPILVCGSYAATGNSTRCANCNFPKDVHA